MPAGNNTVELFRESIGSWRGSYSRVLVSYLAIRNAEGKLLMLSGSIVLGTELDIQDSEEIFVRSSDFEAGSFRVQASKPLDQIIDEAIDGRIVTKNFVLNVATGSGGQLVLGFNPQQVDTSKGSQLYKQLWISGATVQEMMNLYQYDPNLLTERLHSLPKPFKTFLALAKHVNIGKELVDRGSCLVVTARSPARIEAESRVVGDEATVSVSLGKNEKPSGVQLSYVVTRGDEDTPNQADLSGKFKQDTVTGPWTGAVTFNVGKADNVKLYLSRDRRMLGETDLYPQQAPDQPGKKAKKRGRVFQSIFDTYTGSGAQREGATGYVLKVTNEDDEIFALKYLKPEKMDSKRKKRFRHEMSFCIGFRHDNVVRVIDWGGVEIDKTTVPFYVMPYYEKGLRNLISGGLDKNKVIPLYLDLIDGLAKVHDRDIVHRDLKPENILYDDTTDKLILADFGVAHFAEEDLYTAVETEFAERLMNFRYAAPEQKQRGSIVTRAADVWAMGQMLNEMFTKTLGGGANGAPTIEQYAPDLAYLDEIVKSMIHFEPRERPSLSEVRRLILARKGRGE